MFQSDVQLKSAELLAKHLWKYRANLPARMKIEAVDTVCAFTGEPITEGIRLRSVVSDVFTDWEYVRHESGYVSVAVALTIAEVIRTPNGLNSLRNYSFFANEHHLRILRRDEVLDTLLTIPEGPFVMGVSFSNKKHIGFKCSVETDARYFHVTTDTGKIYVNRDLVNEVLPVMRRWYTIVPGKEHTEAKPTYFTKEEIRHGDAYFMRQITYGRHTYEAENEFLRRYRGTQLFELLLFALNKSIK